MENMNLSYYTNDVIPELNHDPLFFFEMQDVIKDDLKRIKYMLESYTEDKAKKNLIKFLDDIIKNIQLNRFSKGPEMELNIYLLNDYLIFSYYSFDERGRTILETPTIVIMSRALNKICFIDEVYSVFRDEEENDQYNRGHDEIWYFKLENKTVTEYNATLEEYTVDLFSDTFIHTDIFLKRIESISIPYHHNKSKPNIKLNKKKQKINKVNTVSKMLKY